jgi:probable H4MPT-linked C1 transfer pathway protein
MTPILGLDIGGANLKAAHTSGVAITRPFALWKHPGRLAAELGSILAAMPAHDRLAVTMTGELCDCFPSKRAGVLAILLSVEQAAGAATVDVWTTRAVFATVAQVREEPLAAAAVNWLALAQFATRFTEHRPALLIDTGSTTTDIVYLHEGRACPLGRTDRERLASGELVYTGVRRTPVCAVLGLGVAAEFFATMLDVYLWLGIWPEDAADTDTADGGPATRDDSRARLARMLCADADDVPTAEIDALAQRASIAQADYVRAAIDRVLANRAEPQRVIFAGSGEIVGRLAWATHPRLLGRPFTSLADRLGRPLSEAVCAYAVAMLAAESGGRRA